MTSSNKPDFDRIVSLNFLKLTSLLQHVDKLEQAGKIDNLQLCLHFMLFRVANYNL